MRVGGQTLARVATLIDSHQLSSSFDRALTSYKSLYHSLVEQLEASLLPASKSQQLGTSSFLHICTNALMNTLKIYNSVHLLKKLYSGRPVGGREKFHNTRDDSLLIFFCFEQFTNLEF